MVSCRNAQLQRGVTLCLIILQMAARLFQGEESVNDLVGEQRGMSLRDWFAGQALAVFSSDKTRIYPVTAENMSRSAYLIADAMLKERASGDGE